MPNRTVTPVSRYQVEPSMLPHNAQRILFESTLRTCYELGYREIAVYPAGQHTQRLDPAIFEKCGVRLAAVFDDHKSGSQLGLSVTKLEDCSTRIDAIVLSTDQWELKCLERAQTTGLPVHRPYEALEFDHLHTHFDHRHSHIERMKSNFQGKLNLGCGNTPLPGWTNVDSGDGVWHKTPKHPDVITLDVFEAMAALPDCSCDMITSEHFFEHFTLQHGYAMAREWERLLRPGGVVRVVTPDLDIEARLLLGLHVLSTSEVYAKHKKRWLGPRHSEEANRFLTRAMLFNFGMRLDGHQFVYDFETLQAQLEASGLTNVTKLSFGKSNRSEMQGIDQHDGGSTGGDWAKSIQLVVEAEKPVDGTL